MSHPALEARLKLEVGRAGATFAIDAELSLVAGVLVLFGPSGSGKSLTVQAIAGLLRPREGRVAVGGEALFDADKRVNVPVHKRKIGYVPQQQSLFPFLDVADNVVFGLPRTERNPESPSIVHLLEELGIAHIAHSRPDDLSGGERQRVALARALATSPRLLLLDEPFAAIDQEGRAALRKVLHETLKRRNLPAVFVTHDPDEALDLGDTLVRFERGRTTTSGTPAELLRRGEPVVIAGEPVGPAESLGRGRGTMTLREVKVEAPLELFEQTEDGQVRLVLRTRPRGGKAP